MKKLLLFLLFIPVLSNAQTFGEIGSVWNTSIHFQANAGPGAVFSSDEYRCIQAVDDTVIGGDTHLLLDIHTKFETYHTGTQVYTLEESDSSLFLLLDSNIVYIGQPGNMQMIYDFNLEVGDSLVYSVAMDYCPFGCDQDTVIVETVDSVLINGTYRKRISFSDFTLYEDVINYYEMPGMVWLEGIGDTVYGPFARFNEESVWLLPNRPLNCFVEDDNVWMGNCDPFYACNGIVTGVTELTADQFKLYPNPVEDILKLEVTFDDEFNLYMTNINGRNIQEYRHLTGNQQLDASDLVPGIYLIHISDGESKITQKVIKL